MNAKVEGLIESLREYVAERMGEYGMIWAERREELGVVAEWVRGKMAAGEPARLTFVCTHNSRRSHLSQLWAQVGAYCFGIVGVETYSGGTEETACNLRTVRALRRAGMLVEDSGGGENPVYLARFAADQAAMRVFSKVYDAGGNPTEGFAAVMTCDHVDENCPVVIGAEERFPVHYRDPKESDGSAAEEATYDERCAQIAREMLFLMSRVDCSGAL